MSSQQLAYLLDALHDARAQVRAQSVDALGDIGDPAAIEPLRALLEDEDLFVRVRAVRSLRQIGGPSAVDALLLALTNTLPAVRRAVIVSLSYLEDERCYPALVNALKSETDERVQRSIVLTLRQMDAPAAPAPEDLM